MLKLCCLPYRGFVRQIFESARHFRIESNRDFRFEFESNLEALQVPNTVCDCVTVTSLTETQTKQEAQLSQRGRAMPRVVEYFR